MYATPHPAPGDPRGRCPGKDSTIPAIHTTGWNIQIHYQNDTPLTLSTFLTYGTKMSSPRNLNQRSRDWTPPSRIWGDPHLLTTGIIAIITMIVEIICFFYVNVKFQVSCFYISKVVMQTYAIYDTHVLHHKLDQSPHNDAVSQYQHIKLHLLDTLLSYHCHRPRDMFSARTTGHF